MSYQPARLVALDGRKGKLAPGWDADLVVFDPQAEFVVTTHPAPDAALQRTRRRIVELDVVWAVQSFLRVL